MDKYRALSESDVIAYIKDKISIFPLDAKLNCKEIGDGNLNLVFHVYDEDADNSVIVKQSLPYARIDETIAVPLDRARIESEALLLQGKICPGLVPKVYHYDQEMYLTIMEDLSDHGIVRKGLIDGNQYPKFPKDMAVFLARTLFFTSDLGLDPLKKKDLQRKFINPALCKITEDLVFTDPYYDAPGNRIDPPIRERVEENFRDQELIFEVAKLKEKFMTQGQALLHGDLHTGSIFVTPESTKVIDPEFAFYGPMGFDIGALIGNILLNYVAQMGHMKNLEVLSDFRQYLIDTMVGLWNEFEKQFRGLWRENVKSNMEQNVLYMDDYMGRLLHDAIGYAGCKATRRIYGLAHVADIDTIEDETVRAKAQILVLDIARELILSREDINSIEEVAQIIRRQTK